jgi:predicted PurR-regulated permease PerM
MTKNNSNDGNGLAANPVVHYSIQLLALALLLVWCFRIVEPFITPLIWGSVLAITLYPLHRGLSNKLRGRNILSATIITLLMVLMILGPAVWLLLATVNEFRDLGEAYKTGALQIPPPPENVKDWPVVGNTIYGYWTDASKNLTALVTQHKEQVKSVLLQLLGLLKNTAAGLVMFLLSLIVSGVLLAFAKPAGQFARDLLVRIAGKAGESLTESAELTVRNVAKGVLGVAIIQSLLAGIGFVLAGIPLAGLWIIVCLVLAIVQLGLLPVSAGVIIYIWGHGDTLTASLLTGWMIFVGVIDNILKPILLGKGAPAPMLVVFLGAIGGFIMSGFIGLFTGAIILTLGYKMVIGWLMRPEEEQKSETPPEPISQA